MENAILELEDAWKIYTIGEDLKVPAIKGVSIQINKGQFISIMGPSGSGKSTLLNLLGTLDIPTKGKIFLKGKDISKLTENELAQVRGKTIGFVFQAFNLLSEFTAIENVMLPMMFQNIDPEDQKKKAMELLKKVGIADRAKHKPNELSGGQRQRVAIARALANDPEIILADEPTGNLDSRTGQQIMDLLVELHKKEGRTIIVVTHDPRIAQYTKNEEEFLLEDGKFTKNNHHSKQKFLWRGETK
ncbi:MAG TPA: ABC transporter ATP-binding protein [Candidatus Woesearchaeota archaeon]|nr:ABC transporter ATP-binding protein [Candidatus Woesearchaeota archaeon]